MAPIDHTLEMNCGQAMREDYQRFLLLGGRRAPLTLYVHERGYRSDIINTDALGLRYSHLVAARHASTCWWAARPHWESARVLTSRRWPPAWPCSPARCG